MLRLIAGVLVVAMDMILNYGNVNTHTDSINWFFLGTGILKVVFLLTDLLVFALYFKLLIWFFMMKLKLQHIDQGNELGCLTFMRICWVIMLSLMFTINSIACEILVIWRNIAWLIYASLIY